MECNKLLQNVTECRCLIHEMLWNIEAETTQCYKMIYKLIEAPTIHNILLNSVNYISTYCYLAVFSIPV